MGGLGGSMDGKINPSSRSIVPKVAPTSLVRPVFDASRVIRSSTKVLNLINSNSLTIAEKSSLVQKYMDSISEADKIIYNVLKNKYSK